MAATQVWQYKVIPVKGSIWGSETAEDMQVALNAAGREGWELVTVARAWDTGKVWLYLKRPA